MLCCGARLNIAYTKIMSLLTRASVIVVAVAMAILAVNLYSRVTSCANHVKTFAIRHDAVAVIFSPDGTLLAVGQRVDDVEPDRGLIEVYNLKTNKKVFSAQQKSLLLSCAFSPDGKYLASIGIENDLLLYNTRTGRVVRKVSTLGFPLRFSPDGKTLAGPKAALQYQMPNPKVVPFKSSDYPREESPSRGWRAVAFSLDGKTVATSIDETAIRLWDTSSGRLKKSLKGHDGTIQELAYLRVEGKAMLASFDEGGDVLLWNAATGKLMRRNTVKDGGYTNISLAPKSGIYAGGSWATDLFENGYGWIDIRDIRTNQELCEIKGLGKIYTVALSSDGKSMAFGSDYEVQVWRIK